MRIANRLRFSVLILLPLLLLAACGNKAPVEASGSTEYFSTAISEEISRSSAPAGTVYSAGSALESGTLPMKNGFITEQILQSPDGDIHYSYYLPEGYDPRQIYPLMVVMPGYGEMWFGEASSGKNLDWSGALVWTKLEEKLIVVSAQLTDWGETSARQAIYLTEYFLQNFAVDPSRVYAAGYSAGGETMSRAVSMRPELYAAYLHGASQWDGTFAEVAENGVAVYIYMAEGDEYYGSQKARDAYNGLLQAYEDAGWPAGQIDAVLHLEIPGNEYFNRLGIYNYHGGGNILFDDTSILHWILEKTK